MPPFYTGIISWGPNSCGEKYRPGVYTRSTLQIVFLNIIKKRLLLELATTSLGLCGTQRNTRTTGHITQFSQIQSWFQSSHTKNKYTQWCPCVSKCLCDKEKQKNISSASIWLWSVGSPIWICTNHWFIAPMNSESIVLWQYSHESPSEFHNFIGRSMYFFYWKILQITADSSSHVRYSSLHKKEQKVEQCSKNT